MIKRLTGSIAMTSCLLLAATTSLADDDDCGGRKGFERVEVSGKGIHYFDSAIEHNSRQTPAGKLRKTTTETIDLAGDLEGRVLYQPTGEYDFAKYKLVNTGKQVFSGTIAGSKPVLLFDDEFRFEVNLATGETLGRVYLTERIAGPKASCELEIRNSASPPTGAPEFVYTGVCWIKKRSNDN